MQAAWPCVGGTRSCSKLPVPECSCPRAASAGTSGRISKGSVGPYNVVPLRHSRSQSVGSRRTRSSCKQWQARAESNDQSKAEPPVQYATQFGYNRKDVIIVGVGLLVLGYAAYYGLQSAGIEAGQAGNFVQLGVFVILSFGWTASYLFRVINKDMTYSKQLKQYEEAVMQKRLEEMPETERSRLYEEVEAERARSK